MATILFVFILIAVLILVLAIERPHRVQAVRVEVNQHKPRTKR